MKARRLDGQAILLLSDFKGLPIALLEAMAAGVVPALRRIASGIPALVADGPTGRLVSEDPEEAARALRRLADAPAPWQRCSTAARELVSTHCNAEASHLLWRRLLEDLDHQGKAAPSSPDPIAWARPRIRGVQNRRREG